MVTYDRVSQACFWTSDCETPKILDFGAETVTRTEGPVVGMGDAEWTKFGNKYYKIVNEHVTFLDAEVIKGNEESDELKTMAGCNALNAHLVQLTSKEEIEFIKDFAAQDGQDEYWVGGTDMFNEGQWVWIGSQDPVSVTDWQINEPNGIVWENCMSIRDPYRMNDLPCNVEIEYICEKR